MLSLHASTSSGFVESVQAFLPTVTGRLIEADHEREAVLRLRYDAYEREGTLPPDAPRRFEDRFDDLPNARMLGLFVGDRLVSSIRLHVGTRDQADMPGMQVFADYLRPRLAAGQVIVDPTRFVIEAEAAREFPRLPFATVRLAWMAAEWFGADLLLAAVRVEHQPFYRRLFGHTLCCAARTYPMLSKPISLMELDFPQERDHVLRRYPFFQSTMAERAGLFGGEAGGNQPDRDTRSAVDRLMAGGQNALHALA